MTPEQKAAKQAAKTAKLNTKWHNKARLGGFELADDFDTQDRKMQKGLFKKAKKDYNAAHAPVNTSNVTKRFGFNPYTSGGMEHARLPWLDQDYEHVRDTMYDPTMKTYLDEATTGVDVENRKALAAADVEHSFAGQDAQLRRQMGRFGIDPTDPAYLRNQNQLSIGKATGKAGAISGARTQAEQENFGRLSDAVGKVSPMMQAYLQQRGQVGLGLRSEQMRTFSNMYGAEKGLAGDKLRADASRYGADQSLAGTMAQIASNERINAANHAGGGGGHRGGGGGSSRGNSDAYYKMLADLNKQESAALQQYQDSGPSGGSYWGNIVGAVAPALVEKGIDWLFD